MWFCSQKWSLNRTAKCPITWPDYIVLDYEIAIPYGMRWLYTTTSLSCEDSEKALNSELLNMLFCLRNPSHWSILSTMLCHKVKLHNKFVPVSWPFFDKRVSSFQCYNHDLIFILENLNVYNQFLYILDNKIMPHNISLHMHFKDYYCINHSNNCILWKRINRFYSQFVKPNLM